MSGHNSTSKAEALAHKWFEIFNNHKMLLLFFSMLCLTASSIYFNFRLGRLNASASDFTWYVMPLSYSFLDIRLLAIGMALFCGVISGFLRVVSWVWFYVLLTLSLFACLSCLIALDAEKASSGDAFKRQQLERALATANDSVDTWSRNVALTIKHKSRFQDRLDHAIYQRDSLVNEISELDSSTPPSQVIFEKAESFLPVWMDGDMFKTLSRLTFGVSMIVTPLLVTAILSQVLSLYSSSTPPSGGRKRVSPEQNHKFTENKWPNFTGADEPAPIRAEFRESADSSGPVTTSEEVEELDREALRQVRQWLKGEEGNRVTRQQIKYRSGQKRYEQVSLIIAELEREGWLNRMKNRQLKATRPQLRAVN